MIRFDSATDKIAIDTEVWTGNGKITIARGRTGVSIRYGDLGVPITAEQSLPQKNRRIGTSEKIWRVLRSLQYNDLTE